MFQSAIIEFWLPVFGDVKFVTSTIFDIGVYIVVVGLALDVLRSLGAEIDEHFEEGAPPTEESRRDQELPREAAEPKPREGESMSVNLTLLTVMGVLYACGIYLILERSLTRVLLGLMLLANATNLLILTTGGYAGLAPLFSKDTDPGEYNDPLPQALILTSIVISFAVTAFMLGIIYRTWVLARQDEIQDDAEDRARRQDAQLRRRGRLRDPGRNLRIPVDHDRLGRPVGLRRPRRRRSHGQGGRPQARRREAASEEQPGSLNVTPPNRKEADSEHRQFRPARRPPSHPRRRPDVPADPALAGAADREHRASCP